MRILVGCEFSGIVRDAFRARGHDAISCDLLPSERHGPHMQCDVRKVCYDTSFDLFIVFPPCTYLCSKSMGVERKISAYCLHCFRQMECVSESSTTFGFLCKWCQRAVTYVVTERIDAQQLGMFPDAPDA